MTSRPADPRPRLTGDEFASLVTHELRNPLNAMGGWLHLLSSARAKPETAERALAGLHRALEQQLAQIDTLGRVLRLSADSGVQARVPVDLAGLLAACAATLRPGAETSGRTVALYLPPSPASGAAPGGLEGDPEALRSAFCALGAHALRHGVPGAALRIALHPGGPDAGPRVVLSIDEGDEGGLSIWHAFGGGGARLPLELLHAALAVEAHGAQVGPQADGRVGDALEIRFDAIDATASPLAPLADSTPGGARS
jgi:signal transduction histidine kinase